MLVHFLDRFLRYFASGLLIAEKGSGTVSHGGRYPAQRHNSGHAAHAVRASAEPEQEYAIAGLPHLQDRSVAVDDIQRYAETRRLARDVMSPNM
jgi:hypothetical protein